MTGRALGTCLATLAVVIVALAPKAGGAQQQRTRSTSSRPAPRTPTALERADQAWSDGDRAAAERLYAEALAANPSASRAAYRLASLRRDRPAESIALLRRYVALEPRDAWGHLALADALARVGAFDEALAAVDTAARLAPAERDVSITRAKVLERARRLDAADSVLGAWTAQHADDAEAWRTLGTIRRRTGRERGAVAALERAQSLAPDPRTARQLAAARAMAAPRLTTAARGSRDSDANMTYAATLGFDALAADRARIGGTVTTRGASYLGASAGVVEGTVRLAWRPRATTTLTGEVGAVRFGAGPSSADTTIVTRTTPTGSGNGRGQGSSGSGTTTTQVPLVVVHPGAAAATVPVVRARARWRAGDGSAVVDLRAGRAPLDATPALLANRVIRTDAGLMLERALAGPLRVRGIGQAAQYDEPRSTTTTAEPTNLRTTFGGGPVVDVTDGMQLALIGLRSAWRRATTAGYFAAQRVDLAELGLYAEHEMSAATLAVDAGAGAQRVTRFGVLPGRWEPAARLWAQLAVPLGAAQLTSEVDLYRSQLSDQAATTAEGWRYGAASLGVRVPLR